MKVHLGPNLILYRWLNRILSVVIVKPGTNQAGQSKREVSSVILVFSLNLAE